MSTEASAVSTLSIRQLKAACALLAWSSQDLAQAAGLAQEAVAAILDQQGMTGSDPATEERARTALEAAGVVFLGGDGRGPGVRLRQAGPPDEGMRPNQLTSENDG